MRARLAEDLVAWLALCSDPDGRHSLGVTSAPHRHTYHHPHAEEHANQEANNNSHVHPDGYSDTPNYDTLYDANDDCVIDIVDIMLVASHWGDTCRWVSGYVWNDDNGDTVRDEIEVGIAGVTIDLYCDDGDGVCLIPTMPIWIPRPRLKTGATGSATYRLAITSSR